MYYEPLLKKVRAYFTGPPKFKWYPQAPGSYKYVVSLKYVFIPSTCHGR